MKTTRRHTATMVLAVASCGLAAVLLFVGCEGNNFGNQIAKNVQKDEIYDGEDVMQPFGSYSTRDGLVYFVKPSGDQSLVREADPDTFVVIKDDFGKDSAHVYFGGEMIYRADPQSFQIIISKPATINRLPDGPALSKDLGHVFADNSIIDAADPLTFKIVNNDYQVDKKFVYYRGSPLNGSNPATFYTLGRPDADAKDSGHVYNNGQVIRGANPEAF